MSFRYGTWAEQLAMASLSKRGLGIIERCLIRGACTFIPKEQNRDEVIRSADARTHLHLHRNSFMSSTRPDQHFLVFDQSFVFPDYLQSDQIVRESHQMCIFIRLSRQRAKSMIATNALMFALPLSRSGAGCRMVWGRKW